MPLHLLGGGWQEEEGVMFLILSLEIVIALHFGWAVLQGTTGLVRKGTMRVTILNRIMLVAAIVTVSLVGMSILTNAQEQRQQNQEKQDNKKQKDKKQSQQQDKNKQQHQDQNKLQQKQDQPQGWDQGKKVGWSNSNVPPGQQNRLPQQRQQQLIVQQQQRLAQYRQYLDQQQHLAEQRTVQLQQQKRMAQYRYQQQYLEGMRRQQMRLQSEQLDYSNDPYYYTAPSFRYNRGGSYYETNQYGADQLRQSVNNGYEQGFRAGQADRQDRWNANYKGSYAYQDANYGYNGYYVSQVDYNYYFREGFRRGYEDGYNSRTQYGSQSDGSYSMLGSILSQILNLQSLR